MEVKTYFKIAKNWYGKKMKIRVQFNTGNYVNNIYEYDHDELATLWEDKFYLDVFLAL